MATETPLAIPNADSATAQPASLAGATAEASMTGQRAIGARVNPSARAARTGQHAGAGAASPLYLTDAAVERAVPQSDDLDHAG